MVGGCASKPRPREHHGRWSAVSNDNDTDVDVDAGTEGSRGYIGSIPAYMEEAILTGRRGRASSDGGSDIVHDVGNDYVDRHAEDDVVGYRRVATTAAGGGALELVSVGTASRGTTPMKRGGIDAGEEQQQPGFAVV